MTNEKAFFFPNRRGQYLYGVHCFAPAPGPAHLGVVLCYPILQELAASYRVYAVLARRLAEHGISSLRFQCAGMGNSEGDSSEATLDTFINDTMDAVEWLVECDHVNVVGLVGTRLGATIAALVAERHPLAMLLGLHTPVVSGEEYWSSLLKGRQIMEIARKARPQSKQQVMDELAARGRIELLADLWSREFILGLREVDLERRAPAEVSRLMLAATVNDKSAKASATMLADKYRNRGAESTLWAEDHRAFWTTKSMQEGYLPHAYLDATVAWLSGQSR